MPGVDCNLLVSCEITSGTELRADHVFSETPLDVKHQLEVLTHPHKDLVGLETPSSHLLVYFAVGAYTSSRSLDAKQIYS